MTAWQLVDDVGSPASGVDHMRADLDLLAAAAAGAPPTLRIYTWAHPTLSLGRFQPDDDVDAAACARFGVETVRRPTGGRALLHGGDLTYAVAMRRPSGAAGSVDGVYRFVAGGIIAGLARLGVDAAIAHTEGGAGAICFAGQLGSDLRVGDRKVCGSAQVHRDGAVLQHGAILLERLAFDETDLLAGDHDRDRLRGVTVTLDELGAPRDPPVVAAALVAGFAERAEGDIEHPNASAGGRSLHCR
jgi:lipoate-protein ligase A